jgi:Flp pilus assembly protein TadG
MLRTKLRLRLRHRDDRGAVAIMFALLSIMLLTVAALATDIGNAAARHTTTQTQADFAALAGGQLMTATGTKGMTVSPAIAAAVAAELNNNQPQDDGVGKTTCVQNHTCVTAAQLTDGDLTNGEVRYVSGGLQVISPSNWVAFGMAKAIGIQGTHVSARATVQIFSPGEHVLPYYAAQGCDYGTQTISQTTNGQDATTVNLYEPPGTDNTATESGLVTTPPSAANSAGVPYPVPANTPLEIDGTGFTNVNMVGFFESGGTVAGPAPKTIAITKSMITGDTVIKIPDISGVGLSQDVWYVRVSTDGGATWSAEATGKKLTTLNALPLSVGSPNLVCGGGSTTGNFGTLDVHNYSPNAPTGNDDNVAYNIAAGLQHPLGLFPSPASPYTCDKGGATPGSIMWPNDNTNCIATQTGSVSGDDAYSGLVAPQWKNPTPVPPALLTNLSAGTGCAASGVPTTTYFNSVLINNDTLSCFFSSPSTTIGDVDTSNYTLSGPAFNTAIWNSPRFVWIPVMTPPTCGNCTNYQILDFRPAYITDQLNSATQSTPLTSCSNTVCNGLTLGNNGHSIAPLKVVLLNIKSLPPPPNNGPVSPYNGIGPPIVRLVN